MRITAFLVSFCLLLACDKTPEQAIINVPMNETTVNPFTYLALGDSYTIGEAVEQKSSFPSQLASQLNNQGFTFAAPKIIAKTGWTTDELQAAIKAENINQRFNIVTLLIGVNNQYRGYPQTTYRKEFKELLQTAIDFAGKDKKHVFVVSIPDWGVTPFGMSSGKSTATIATEIDAFNAIAKEETLAQGISYIDITPGSRNAAADVALVAKDGLHPSGKMYGEWANNIAKEVVLKLK